MLLESVAYHDAFHDFGTDTGLTLLGHGRCTAHPKASHEWENTCAFDAAIVI